MASEESDKMPMLGHAASAPRSHTVLELANLSSSYRTSSRHAPPASDRRYFSVPLQPLQLFSGTLTSSTSTTYTGTSGASKFPTRFYSGPIQIQNEAAESSSVIPPVSTPTRRRRHSPANEHLLRSGPLGKCDDPYCTYCPIDYDKRKPGLQQKSILSQDHMANASFSYRLKKVFTDMYAWCLVLTPGVMNPHTKRVQQWNKFFLISCLLAVFVDPLFFFILSVNSDFLCIYFNLAFAKAITVLRSATDLVYLMHMFLQSRLAYIEPSSVGTGALVDDPRSIMKHYITGWFVLDVIVVIPLPQIMLWLIIPKALGTNFAANYAKNLIRIIVLLQYIPRMIRFFPLIAGNSPTGFIFETARANFIINLLLFLLVAHVVGSCWYLFGLQRVNQCLQDVCVPSEGCAVGFLDCGDGRDVDATMRKINASSWDVWKENTNAQQCLSSPSQIFNYGIYSSAVNVTMEKNLVPKYIYSLFWGFQQISTLAGNLMPSLFIGEVLFVLGVVVLGLFLLVLLIGNMQNFLLSLSRRKVDMQLTRRDVESWMARRRLPPEIRRKVREAERFRWAANRGVNEEELLKGLPEDVEKEIRKALCIELIKKVRLFTFMEEQVLDAISQRLRQSLYIQGSEILRKNHPIEKMHFFIRGNLLCQDEHDIVHPLQSGFCGEELLTWCLESDAERRNLKGLRHRGVLGPHAISRTTVTCSGNVEAFSLSSADLKEVTRHYSRFLRSPKVQGALRYESSYWRTWAAKKIQATWRDVKRKRASNQATSEGPSLI